MINKFCLPALLVIAGLMTGLLPASRAWSTPDTLKPKAPKAAASAPANSAVLSLSEYLGEVSSKHQSYRAADQTAKAAKAEAEEGSLLFKPSLSGSAVSSTEGITNPLVADERFHTRQYKIGVTEQTPFGLSGGLYFNRNELNFPSMYFGFGAPLPATDYTANYFSLEFSQSLLRNFNGGESRRQRDQITNGSLAKSYAQSYMLKSVLLEAETLYWQLALAREMVKMQTEAVDRAQRLFDWTNRHVHLELADRAAGLQASTNLRARQLDLRTAQDSERVAAQAFNSSRGILNTAVEERLTDFTPDLIAKYDVPERTVERDDVRAAEFSAKSTQATALLAKERNKPTLELFGSLPLSAPADPSAAAAIDYPVNARPATSVGLRLTASLDVGTQNSVRQGYAAEAQAADWTYQRKVFEEERDWQDLTAKFSEAKQRLTLFNELETTQGERLRYERDLQKRGRSTLQQVILDEADYQAAQLGRIRTLAEILTLNAQMKLYGVSYESR